MIFVITTKLQETLLIHVPRLESSILDVEAEVVFAVILDAGCSFQRVNVNLTSQFLERVVDPGLVIFQDTSNYEVVFQEETT